MKYGKLFKKFMNKYPQFNDFSANRFSELSHKELWNMAKTLYRDGHNENLKHYQNMSHDILAGNVWATVRDL